MHVMYVPRYPYYALSVLNMEAKVLTWLRYTVWVPLYPLGFTCEGIINSVGFCGELFGPAVVNYFEC